MEARLEYLLHLADNALILGHRNSEWCGHGPELEQDIALTNISLDLLGQARHLYQHAATSIGNGATEDTLAYLRDAQEFRNLQMLELPRGDWGFTLLRQYLFSEFSHLQYESLQHSGDTQLAAIAAKSLIEVAYHRRWSSEWVVRLGDGTEESHRRMTAALDSLWPDTREMFAASTFETTASEQGIGVDPSSLQTEWQQRVREVLTEAGLASALTKTGGTAHSHPAGGKQGRHTDHLATLLSEMQYLQRTYPGNEW
jgi:ring-1,2-phenylacetyl-CoA epoxidase subunit PaaC